MLFCLWDDAYEITLAANLKFSPCSGGIRFPLSLSEWTFTVCPTPYNRKQNVLSTSLNKTFPSFRQTLFKHTSLFMGQTRIVTCLIYDNRVLLFTEYEFCLRTTLSNQP